MYDLSEAANREWERLREEAARNGIDIPGLDPRLNAEQLLEIQERLHPEDHDWIAVTNPSTDDGIFICIANTDFPERVDRWLATNSTSQIQEANKAQMATPRKPSD